ncbi:MAG TPA: GNAT family N-acetyltransferase [Oculatellaceae cyanobacterium]|jgi:GNAT superfamily N-acetyltransferase
MIKIRALKPGDVRQVLSLLNRYTDRESEHSVLHKMQQLYIPLHRLSQLLPMEWQFLPAIFVAASRDKVLGLIWLSRDGGHPRRWRIDHLIMDPESCSYDVGTQLVNYVINRFGGDGVQTFLAFVDQYYNTGLALLKSCGFRRCGRKHAFMHTAPAQLKTDRNSLEGLRESHNSDRNALCELYNSGFPVEARVSLDKHWRDFNRPFFKRAGEKLKGLFFKRWVIEDVARDCLIASVALSTEDYKDFYVDIAVNPGWESMYQSALSFAAQQILLITSNARIFIECYEFHKHGLEALEALGFQRTGITEVLVKDYWIPVDDKGFKLKSPILLFSGKTSPAMNCHPR